LTVKVVAFTPPNVTLVVQVADAHRALALAYGHKGQYPQAISEARRGVELDPNDYEQASLGYVYAVAGK
jgi:Flp pilus assembly protein TadD